MNRRPPTQHDSQHTSLPTKKESTPSHPQSLVQRAATQGLHGLRPADILQLQKTMGNAAVAQLAQGTLNTPASGAPIQRIETSVAERHLFGEFGANAMAPVWNILVQWLASFKLKISQFGFFDFIGVVYDLNKKLDQAFPEWLKDKKINPKDSKDRGDLFLKFLMELSTADPATHKYFQWLITQPIKLDNWPENDDSDDYKPELNYDDDDEIPDDDEITLDDPSAEELLLIAQTGNRSDLLTQNAQTAIDKVQESDNPTFQPEMLDSIMKRNPKLKLETERRQFKKKGSSEFTMRPKGTGEAKMVLESFIDPYTREESVRTVMMESEVVPMATTGRPSAPEPESNLRVGTSAKGFTRKGASATDAYNNQGFVDAQKGHIIALELGGPDLPKNIVPQWANWQGNGYWRKMETFVLATAKEVARKSKQKHGIQMRVHVHYKSAADNSMASFRSLAFPTGFTVEVWEIDSKTKAPVDGFRYQKLLPAAQDHTDDKMMFRQDHALMVASGQESPYDKSILSKSRGGQKATGTRKPRAKAQTPRGRKAVTTTTKRTKGSIVKSKQVKAEKKKKKKATDKITPPQRRGRGRPRKVTL